MTLLKAAPGAGGVEIGNARYLPDGDGKIDVAAEHVDYAKACGYAEVAPPDAPAGKSKSKPAEPAASVD